MNVSSYEKNSDGSYYTAEVCQKNICGTVDNLIKIKNKRGIPQSKLMYLEEEENLSFLPVRIAESSMVSSIKDTLDESSSCWDIDPCYKSLRKYCCDEKSSTISTSTSKSTGTTKKETQNNNGYIFFVFGFFLFLFIMFAVYMLVNGR